MTNPYANGVPGDDRWEISRSAENLPGYRGTPAPSAPAPQRPYSDSWAPMTRPVVPAQITGVIALMAVGTLFWAFMMAMDDDPTQSYAPLFMISLCLTLGLGWALFRYASQGVRIGTTVVAVLLAFTGVGLFVSVPLVVLLWKRQVTEYIAESEAYRFAQHQS